MDVVFLVKMFDLSKNYHLPSEYIVIAKLKTLKNVSIYKQKSRRIDKVFENIIDCFLFYTKQ